MVDDVQKHTPAHPPAEGEAIGWLQRIIGYCARNPLITLVAVLALTFGGWQALQRAPLDAIPDLSDVQVIVFTDWPPCWRRPGSIMSGDRVSSACPSFTSSSMMASICTGRAPGCWNT